MVIFIPWYLIRNLVGDFKHPSEKYDIVKLDRISPSFGVKIPKKIRAKPTPSQKFPNS